MSFKENGQVSLIHEKRPNHLISKKKSINREFSRKAISRIWTKGKLVPLNDSEGQLLSRVEF